MMIYLLPVIFSICCLAPVNSFATPVAGDPTIDSLRRQIASTSNSQEKALIHQRLGDQLAASDDYAGAAKEYLTALSLYHGFSTQDRVRMAQHISWADRYADAIRILRDVITEDPGNVSARIHLARTLSWNGNLDEAIAEANLILIANPQNREALLIKANALRWRGDQQAATAIYRQLLGSQEEFDARLGLAHSLLRSGDKDGAVASGGLLKPQYPYQERELRKLQDEIDSTFDYRLDLRASYYSDSDDNRVRRGGLGIARTLSWGSFAANYLYTDAHAPAPHRRAAVHSLTAGVNSTLAERFRVNGGIGIHFIDDAATTTLPGWRLGGDTDLGKGSISIALTKDLLTDTAELLDNGIRCLSIRTSITQQVAERVSISASYTYRDYSDDNHAHDVNVAPTYTILSTNPVLRIGYRFRYLDFDRQSRGGYFDPDNYLANQLVLSLNWEIDRFYLYLEPYGGYQSYRRYGSKTDELFGGAAGTLGYHISKRVVAELSGEFGNYAGETASGFDYFQVGGKISFSF